MLYRLRQQVATGKTDLVDLYEELSSFPNVDNTPPRPGGTDTRIAVPFQVTSPWGQLNFLTTATSFSTAIDVGLSEMTIEVFLPADEQTRASLLSEWRSEYRNISDP